MDFFKKWETEGNRGKTVIPILCTDREPIKLFIFREKHFFSDCPILLRQIKDYVTLSDVRFNLNN